MEGLQNGQIGTLVLLLAVVACNIEEGPAQTQCHSMEVDHVMDKQLSPKLVKHKPVQSMECGLIGIRGHIVQ